MGLGGFAHLQPVAVVELPGGYEPRSAAYAGRQPRPFPGRGAENIQGGRIERFRAGRLTDEKCGPIRTDYPDEERLAPAVRMLGKVLAQAGDPAVLVPRAIEVDLGADDLTIFLRDGCGEQQIGGEKQRESEHRDGGCKPQIQPECERPSTTIRCGGHNRHSPRRVRESSSSRRRA